MTDKVTGKKKVNYKEIFDAFPESIIIIDKNFLILDMNDNAETTFRISRQNFRKLPKGSLRRYPNTK